jgi:hypothetical protein
MIYLKKEYRRLAVGGFPHTQGWADIAVGVALYMVAVLL